MQTFIDLDGEPHVVGTLWTRNNKGRESATFEYAKAWLENPARFELEPALALGKGPQHTAAGRSLFGGFGDSAPDRWGRRLILREEQRRAREQKRAPQTLHEVDYLLRVNDFTRQGALRFKQTPDGAFLAPSEGRTVPPLVFLPKLLAAAMQAGTDKESDEDLRLLLEPGSSLGGARPKASVIDKDGALSIAKFPQGDDAVRVPAWEALALELAKAADIETPQWRLETIAQRPVLILRRFDRNGERRIPYLSAMSMLGAGDGDQRSYMEIADALRRYGVKPQDDCAQLWRRIVFNILISNTDDHLRNHGFLYARKGWRLAPAFDLNPVPQTVKSRNLSMAINESDNTASLEIAMEVADHFYVKPKRAREIAKQVGSVVALWRSLAKKNGLTAPEMDAMASAFEHSDLKLALKLD
ncbi:MAG TPA: type II toxin-antitoxin system HipA family toxin [Rhizomicrobium sp.]